MFASNCNDESVTINWLTWTCTVHVYRRTRDWVRKMCTTVLLVSFTLDCMQQLTDTKKPQNLQLLKWSKRCVLKLCIALCNNSYALGGASRLGSHVWVCVCVWSKLNLRLSVEMSLESQHFTVIKADFRFGVSCVLGCSLSLSSDALGSSLSSPHFITNSNSNVDEIVKR